MLSGMSDKTSQLLIKLSPDLRAEFQSYAEMHGQTMSALVRHFIVDEMREGRLVNNLKPRRVIKGLYGNPAALVKDDNGKIYEVQVVPFRSQTILQIFDPEQDGGFFNLSSARGGSTMLDRVFAVMDSSYDWEAPHYRQLCEELELNPDYRRPQFREEHLPLIDELEQKIAWGQGGNAMRLNELIFDLIDLLRIDIFPEFYDYERSKATLESWSFKVPKSLFLNAFEQVDVDRISSSKPIFTSVTFLPSWEGTGFNSSISLYGVSDVAQDGWHNQDYGDLTGVALMPSRLDRAMSTVVSRLEQQGVTFLSFDEARAYMDTEGAYWASIQGWHNCPPDLQPYIPSRTEKAKWMLKKPPLPLYAAFLRKTRS